MTCDLDRLFGPTAERVPEDEDSSFVFSKTTLSSPPRSLSTDRIVIEKSHHEYDSVYRRDALAFYANKETYRNLALLIVAVLFAPDASEITLSLVHPASNIRRLIVRTHDAADLPGFHSRPLVLNYHPGPVEKHPWMRVVDPRELPAFFLTNAAECVSRESEWEARDTVVGFGSDAGSARFAELLLDASRTSSCVSEFELEGEGGFRGVAPLSCEARLWFPGSFGWKNEFWHMGIQT